MAKRSRRGFRAPRDYDPNRARASKRGRGRLPESDESAQPRRQRPQRDSTGSRERYRPVDKLAPERITARLTTADDVKGLTFAGLGLGKNITESLVKLGAEHPFPIQGAVIPDILAGNHVLGRARTGSGKTIAFGAPLVERLLHFKAAGRFAGDPPRNQPDNKRNRRTKSGGRKPKALILAPTRELALQIDRTVQPIARSVGFYTTQIFGGVPQASQVAALERGVDIVIGTPGRLEDLIEQGRLDLSQVVIAVIDEADHMCDLGFLEPVQRLLRDTRRDAQMLLFSATLDAQVADIVSEFMPEHVAHEVERASAGSTIDHRVFIVMREDKREVLSQLARTPGKILMFTRTRSFAEQLTERFEKEGVRAVALHGDLSQARRIRNLGQFESGRAQVLVATDVAARGIHVPDVDLVIQADPPEDFKSYLHRAGRTGRAGKAGTVVTLIPRTSQKRMKTLLQQAEVVPSCFEDFAPDDRLNLPS